MIMKRLNYILGLLLVVLNFSCVKEKEAGMLQDGRGGLLLNFGSDRNIEIVTRSTLKPQAENKVFNLYVFVFDGSGRKLFGKGYDSPMLRDKDAEVANSSIDCWSVHNDDTPVRGAIKLHVTPGSGYTIYVLANIDADMVNISKDKLGSDIRRESDLLNFKATLNQNTISRNGYFPMSGKVSGVDVSATNISGPDENAFPLKLHRMDAKVKFILKTDSSRPDAAGQYIDKFVPVNWRVVNVPKSVYLLSYEDRNKTETSGQDAGMSYNDFFTSPYMNFEEFPSSDEASFSFYMMESRRSPKSKPAEYRQRSLQEKNSSGMNVTNTDGSKKFVYADDLSTYVEVNGKIEMNLVNDNAGQTLRADVKYIIHLGDFGASVSDYNIIRNHSYEYTVNIVSPNNIRVEVETGTQENQPGATGNLTIAKEEIAICDAHYVTRTMTFHANDITDDLTWYVRTPFCDGAPKIINGDDVPMGLDYKWVKFRLNEKDASGQYFKEQRRPYTTIPFVENTDGTNNDGYMDVSQFVHFLKEQKRKFDISPSASIFDNTSDANGGPKIRVTAFVDEYYYETNPITGKASPDLWKIFVNQPDRYMYILSNSKFSQDKESRMTGSVVTIEQKSIGTIYNVDPAETSLHSAWGMERIDEYPDDWEYNKYGPGNRGNDDIINGRLNTAREWGLADRNNTGFNNNLLWGTFVNFEVANNEPELLKEYRYLRYSCMTRNRDNNADGIIDKDEMRWYMASIRQLVGLWIGVDALDQTSKMYNRSPEERMETREEFWRQHVISSTSYGTNSNNPQIVWAEEGASTGPLSKSNTGRKYTVRCVRDLGMPKDAELSDVPQSYVDVIDNPDGTWEVNNTYLNKACIRYYTSRDLEEGSELSEENKVYWKFLVYSDNAVIKPTNYVALNKKITDSDTGNPYCPQGYRLPNQRELSLMKLNITNLDLPSMPTRTFWSMGKLGNVRPLKTGNDANKTYFGYNRNNGNLFLETGNGVPITRIRCVKDVRVP